MVCYTAKHKSIQLYLPLKVPLHNKSVPKYGIKVTIIYETDKN